MMCILTIKWVLRKLFAGQIHLFWLFAYFSFKHKEKEELAMVAERSKALCYISQLIYGMP